MQFGPMMSQSVVLPASGDSQTLEKTSLNQTLLNQTLVKQTRVHSVRRRRVLFPSRTKRPSPGPEPDLVQRALLLLWALLWLQVYVEETELQSPSTDLPEPESEDSATILDAAQSGVGGGVLEDPRRPRPWFDLD